MKKIQIGKIVKTRGIRGEIKLVSSTNISGLFEGLEQIYIDDDPYTVETVKQVQSCPVLKLSGVETPEAAALLVGRLVYVSDTALPALKEGDYYVKDILGSIVYNDDNGEEIGTLTNVFFTGANDVYEITLPDRRTTLVPAVGEFIKQVDPVKKSIRLHLIDGMLN